MNFCFARSRECRPCRDRTGKIFSEATYLHLSYAGVGIVPLDDDIPTENVMKWLSESDRVGLNWIPVKVKSLKAGTTNNLPSIQGSCHG